MNGRQILKLIILLLLIVPYSNGKCFSTTISGIINNSKEPSLSVEYQRDFLIREKINLKISKNGIIIGKIDILYPCVLKFNNSQIHFEMYAYPEIEISFKADGSSQTKLKSSLKFTGHLGSVNNSLFNLYNNSNLKNMQWSTGDKVSLVDLTTKINAYYNYKRSFLHKDITKIKMTSSIKKILWLDSITDEFTKASSILTLAKKNGLKGKIREQFLRTNIPKSISKQPSLIELNIPALTNYWNYTNLSFLVYLDAEKDEKLYQKYGYYLSALKKIDTSYYQPLKDYSKASLLSDLIENPQDFRPGKDSLMKVVKLFIETANLPLETKKLLEERSHSLHNSSITNLTGTPLPAVDIRTRTGETVNWSKFQDSIIVIDCWASWCAPCIAQFPYIDKIKKHYENKKVTFISISLDETKTNWEKALKNLSLTGTQLYTSGGFKGEFAKKFAVNSLPRYILIRNSVVVNDKAPLPDDPNLQNEIDRLLLN